MLTPGPHALPPPSRRGHWWAHARRAQGTTVEGLTARPHMAAPLVPPNGTYGTPPAVGHALGQGLCAELRPAGETTKDCRMLERGDGQEWLQGRGQWGPYGWEAGIQEEKWTCAVEGTGLLARTCAVEGTGLSAGKRRLPPSEHWGPALCCPLRPLPHFPQGASAMLCMFKCLVWGTAAIVLQG